MRSVFFGLLVTLEPSYFLSSWWISWRTPARQLTRMVPGVQDCAGRISSSTAQLQENISRLNAQIVETNRRDLRQQTIEDLENEVFQRGEGPGCIWGAYRPLALLHRLLPDLVLLPPNEDEPVLQLQTAPWRSSPARWKRNSSA